MFSLWLLIILGFLAQGTVLTSAAIFQARQVGASWLVICLLQGISTILNIIVPYYLTKFLIKRAPKSITGNKFILAVESKSRSLLNKVGENWGLFWLGLLNYLWLNAVIAAGLKISLKKAFVIFFIGETIWFIGLLEINLGVSTLADTNNNKVELLGILLVAFLVSLIIKFFYRNFFKN